MLVPLIEDLSGLGIDPSGCVVAEVPSSGIAVLGGEKDRTPLTGVGREAEGLAHAVLDDHRPGDIGGSRQIVAGPGGHAVEEDLLRHPAAEQDIDLRQQFVGAHQVAVLGRPLLGIAEGGKAAGDDRNLVHRL
jgi:hypothetical protein